MGDTLLLKVTDVGTELQKCIYQRFYRSLFHALVSG